MSYWTVPNVREKKKQQKSQIAICDTIIERICKYYEISNAAIRGRGRQKDLIKARFISMYIIRSTTNFTLVEIGEMFFRDHTTVIHALQVVNDVLSLHYDTDFSDDIKALEKIFDLSGKLI